MPTSQPKPTVDFIPRLQVLGRCTLLFIALVTMILIYPLFAGGEQDWVVDALHTTIIIAGLYAVSSSKGQFFIGLGIGLPFFASLWARQINAEYVPGLIPHVSAVAFYLFAVITVLMYVLRSTRVTIDTLFGAACVYMLMGLAWGNAYLVVDHLNPGAFAIAGEGEGEATANDLVYFSFVTLTTLGYGDVIPKASVVRSLAIVEAMTGVLYSAFLVARLVTLYGIHHRSEPAGK